MPSETGSAWPYLKSWKPVLRGDAGFQLSSRLSGTDSGSVSRVATTDRRETKRARNWSFRNSAVSERRRFLKQRSEPSCSFNRALLLQAPTGASIPSMTLPPRPIPPYMTVAELGADYFWARCPNGHNSRQMSDRYLERRFPRTARLADIVGRIVCKECGARAIGEIEGYPRSGAEGRGASPHTSESSI
jgi:hypothetical protein